MIINKMCLESNVQFLCLNIKCQKQATNNKHKKQQERKVYGKVTLERERIQSTHRTALPGILTDLICKHITNELMYHKSGLKRNMNWQKSN